jgi:hypothetical protein
VLDSKPISQKPLALYLLERSRTRTSLVPVQGVPVLKKYSFQNSVLVCVKPLMTVRNYRRGCSSINPSRPCISVVAASPSHGIPKLCCFQAQPAGALQRVLSKPMRESTNPTQSGRSTSWWGRSQGRARSRDDQEKFFRFPSTQ